MAERFQQRYGIQKFSDNSKEQMHSQIAQQLGGFSSAMGQLGVQIGAKQGAVKAEQAALEYDPASGSPELSDSANRAGEIYNRKVLDAHQQEIDTTYKRSMIELSDKYKDNPESFDAASKKRFEMLSREMHPSLKASLPGYEHLRFVEYNKIQEGQRKVFEQQSHETALGWSDQNRETVVRLLRQGEDESAIAAAEQYKIALANETNLSGPEKAAALSALDRGSIESVLSQQLGELDPIDALVEIEAMRDVFPDAFTADEWDGVIKSQTQTQNARISANKKIETDQAVDISRQVSNLEIAVAGIDEDTPVEEYTKIQDSVTDLYNNGMSVSDRTRLQIKLDKQREIIDERSQNMSDIVARLGGDTSIVVDKAAVNDTWERYEKNVMGDMDSVTRNAHIALFTRKIGVLPDAVIAQTKNDLITDDPELIMGAVDMIDRAKTIRGVTGGFSQADVAYAETVSTLLNYNDPADAIKIATDLVDPRNAAVIQQRSDALKSEKIDWMEETEDVFDQKIFGTTVDKLNIGPLSRDYEKLTADYFKLGMNLKGAKAEAVNDMNVMWGEFDGRLMRYPANDYYQVNGSSDFIQTQLNDAVTDAGMVYDKVYLTSDDRTAREAEAGAPSYVVWGVSDQGMEVTDQRFKPDIKAEQERLTQENLELSEERLLDKHGSSNMKLIDYALPKELQEGAKTALKVALSPIIGTVKTIGAIPAKANIEAAFRKETGRNASISEVNEIYKAMKNTERYASRNKAEAVNGPTIDDSGRHKNRSKSDAYNGPDFNGGG